ncbi:hypothetical protein [Chamaesiphon sp. OTE_75_metabat_556]|uniref:hypothetical protein n=1 Tax=Chamaesiphon sp. OTE_75_metabat_556 TaxID=2964692 RepID=UPI00286C8438|nr:hypothetical protein [Chamaesiphon sp. OTE_75_metabat_556]
MLKFLGCGLLAALAIVTTALQVSAEPPPAEPVIISTGTNVTNDCAQCLPRRW